MEKKDEYVFDFERLEVYQKAVELVVTIFRITRPLPREYQFPQRRTGRCGRT